MDDPKTRAGQFYTDAEKIEALRLLAANNYNYKRTERELKISRKTLKKWQDNFSDNPELIQKKTADIAVYADAVVKTNVSVIERVNEVIMATLKRAEELVKEEKNLDKVSALFTALKDYENAPSDGGKQGVNRMTMAERIERITTLYKS